MTRERPILFSAPMVRAILAGTKTQTRRSIKEAGQTTTRIYWADGVTTVPRGREWSRLSLEITDVRIERVQDISEEDARAEGCADVPNAPWPTPVRDWFRDLWNSINAKRGFGWETNPWAWAISFKRVSP